MSLCYKLTFKGAGSCVFPTRQGAEDEREALLREGERPADITITEVEIDDAKLAQMPEFDGW